VQSQISELDFDFDGYGEKHFERMRAAAAQSQFGEWLAVAAGEAGGGVAGSDRPER